MRIFGGDSARVEGFEAGEDYASTRREKSLQGMDYLSYEPLATRRKKEAQEHVAFNLKRCRSTDS